MSECRRKVSPASAFLPVVICLSPASVFRHPAGHGLVRHCPALPISELDGEVKSIQTSKKNYFLSLSSNGFQFHLCLSAFCEHDLQSLTIVARVEKFCCRTCSVNSRNGQGDCFKRLRNANLQIFMINPQIANSLHTFCTHCSRNIKGQRTI